MQISTFCSLGDVVPCPELLRTATRTASILRGIFTVFAHYSTRNTGKLWLGKLFVVFTFTSIIYTECGLNGTAGTHANGRRSNGRVQEPAVTAKDLKWGTSCVIPAGLVGRMYCTVVVFFRSFFGTMWRS